MFMETSALTGENVEDAFGKLASMIMHKVENGEVPVEVVALGQKSMGSDDKVKLDGSKAGTIDGSYCSSC